MQTEPSYYDDEIDLREIVLTLLNGWKVILLLTGLVGLTAFSLSKWVLPEQYEARAYVAISEPMLIFKDTSEITLVTSLPDITSMVELSKTQALLNKVIATTEIAAYWDAEADSMIDMVEATAVGKDQLRLQVSDTDPEHAASLANIWAEQITEQINMLYSTDAVAQSLDVQISQAQANYAEVQAMLEAELSQSQIDTLEAQLTSTKSDLACTLDRGSAATRILEDLQILAQGLEGQSGVASLSLGDALALTTLQQRTSASQICASNTESPQLQVGNDALANIPVGEALATISKMQDTLQTQHPLLKTEQARLEAEIPSLQRDLANAAYQIDQRVQARDQYQELYAAMLQQESRVKTVLMSDAQQIATISARASIPDEKSSPKTLMNTALGLVLGGMLGVFWVFVTGWWKNSAAEEVV